MMESDIMKISKIACAVIVISSMLQFTPCALCDTEENPVYSVTFDSSSEKYELKEGAALADGHDGKAVKLDGSKGQYVQLENSITEKLSGDYSISVDVYPEDEAPFARIFDLGSGTDNFAYFTSNGGGIPKFRFKGDDLFSDGVCLNINEWNNVVLTKSGSEARLYINGEIAATSDTFVHSLSDLGKTDKNYLGKSQYDHDAYFTGMIDNFMIYDYGIDEGDIKMKLTDGEIQVKSGFKKDGAEILSFGTYPADYTAYAQVKNYKKEPVTAKLVNVVYGNDASVQSVIESEAAEIKPGETYNFENALNFTLYSGVYNNEKVMSYIYTAIGGFEKIASAQFAPDAPAVSPLPEDTLETTVGVHDPSIFKDPKSGTYYVYSTGMIDIYKSEDLINWTKTVNTLPEVPQCVYDMYKHDKKEEYSNIWAPDMFYDESDTATPYHLTCSYSDAFGKNNSSIILFKSASPEGPWENGQIIFTSKSDDEELGKVNAIDSNICTDHETGQKYMVYGSFWQGIHIKELNEDGTVKDPNSVGKRIMSRYKGIGGPEGPYIIYNEETGYYYLFTSYDSLSDTYQIRAARSKSITGPYVDENGNSVDRFDDDESEAKNTYGYKLMGSWQFPFGTTNYGPGHNSVLHDNGSWYLVHHLRNVKGGYATLNIRPMIWNEDGWPMVTPERYQVENDYTIPNSLIDGQWNFISIGDNTNAMITSHKIRLNSDGTIDGINDNINGAWNKNSSDNKITITLNDSVISGYVSCAWDSDANRPTVQFTGASRSGKTIWGKKAVSEKIYK